MNYFILLHIFNINHLINIILILLFFIKLSTQFNWEQSVKEKINIINNNNFNGIEEKVY